MPLDTFPISSPDLQITKLPDNDPTTPTPLVASSENIILPSAQIISSAQVSARPVSPALSSPPSTTSALSVESTSVASTSSTRSTSTPTVAPSQVAANDTTTTSSNPGPNVGLILGAVFGILALLALLLFLVRCMYIRRRRQYRESGQRPAYAKAKFAISAPTNFTVVESGTFGTDGQPVAASLSRPGTSMSMLGDLGSGGNGERVGSPERMRERYPFEAMSGLESGLKDQMQTMKTAQLARKPVPMITVEVDTR